MKSLLRLAAVFGVLLASSAPARADDSAAGLKVPTGFEVSEFAGNDLAPDITCLTIDGQGRVTVAGRGYIRILVDDRKSGKATKAIEVTTNVKDAAHGLLWEGDKLLAVVDGGLWRYQPDGSRELIRKLKTGGEHDAHAIARGPDGWLYLLCGNSARIDRSYASSDLSPIREPVAGAVVRFSPDFKESEIVADGFRNPYGFAFNPAGDLFTFDSDNERCVSLPWYEGTRFYQVRAGGHYGWQNPQFAETWRQPPYFSDVVLPLADLGRGSPTGVACYSGGAWPAHYLGGFFLLDWTFGRIYFVSVTPEKSKYVASKPELFLEATGGNGFAPTAAAFRGDELFVSIGGRGTRGAVYRIRNTTSGPRQLADPPPPGRASSLQTDFRGRMPITDDDVYGGMTATEVSARLRGVRFLQLRLGDLCSRESRGTVFEGYTPRKPIPPDRHPEWRKLLRKAFPSGQPDLDRELSRTLAVLEDDQPRTFAGVLAKITATSDPVEDIHYLIVLSRLRAERSSAQTQAVATALLNLDAKITQRKLNRDRNWPLRVAEIHAELARKDPNLNAAILAHRAFGRPDHALFTRCPGFDRTAAARIFAARAKQDPTFAWDAELVGLLAELPAEQRRPILLRLWDRGGLEDALLPLLARDAQTEDAVRLLGGLASTRLATVAACLDALERIPQKPDGPSTLALIRGLRLLPEGKEGEGLKKRIAALLERQTRQSLGTDKQRWAAWFARAYPALAVKLGGADGVDVAAWQKRLVGIDWSKGDVQRGKAVFVKASCAACHSGGQALGPDLNGAAGRFSRDDLFTAIIQPSKDISPRYRTTQIETTDGKTYLGLIVYEAVDGVLLQTGPAETVRIAGDKIESRRITETSLMPVGLLDKVTDAEIADLYAYLRGGLAVPSR